MRKKDLRCLAEDKLAKAKNIKEESFGDLSMEDMRLIIHDLEVHQIELEMQNEEIKRINLDLDKANARYFDLYDSAPEGYLVVSQEGLILESNHTASNMLGRPSINSGNENLTQYIHKEDQDIFYINRKKLFKTSMPIECELRMIKNDGSILWVRIKSVVAETKDGLVARLILSDISERKTLDLKLQDSLQDLLESQRIASLGTWRLWVDTNKTVWSEELYKIYGRDSTLPPPTAEEYIKLLAPDSWENLLAAMEKTMSYGVPCDVELEVIRKDESKGWIWLLGEAERDEKDKVVSISGTAQDITERKKNENKLIYLSYHDHLTDVYNRRFLEKEIERLDIKENLPLSIIIFDINGLKMVNDSFGNQSGDALLKKAAEIIKKASREEDVVARVGGDEFVVLLAKRTSDETLEIANHIKELASKEKVDNIELSISYGYETKIIEEQAISEIFGNAENHLYQHKLYESTSHRSKTIDIIMNTLFAKSDREAQHSNRVSLICQSIASEMNLNKEIVEKMKIAGLIHDIGKIGVKEEVLNKEGHLTLDERRAVERHPEIGWRLLSATNEFSELAKFVLAHHEKWDGTGYPKGIKGESIPVEARIIAVADAYDAMTSERSYRKPLTEEEAIKELLRCAGTQFDPIIVDLFVNQVLLNPNTPLI